MSQHVAVERRPGESYAVVTVAKEPVNSFDAALWTALHDALRSLEADPSCAGVIITSGLSRDVFTAGNDLRELYAPATSAERYAAFWAAQSRLLVGLYRSRLATCAAVRGACPAGGCAIALACDARLISGNGSMGLNEVALGIPVPKFWGALMGRLAGEAAAERLLLSGRMVGASEALRLGLVDQVVTGAGGEGGGPAAQEALMAAARRWMEGAVKLPGPARAATKAGLRGAFCDAWATYAETEEAAFGWAAISTPKAVAMMKATLERLSRGGGGGGGAGSGGSGGSGTSSKL